MSNNEIIGTLTENNQLVGELSTIKEIEIKLNSGAKGETGSDAEVTTDNVKTALDITTLSGSNTGDQDLSDLAEKANVLELDNTILFTPDADYEPATKKYVDDNSITYIGTVEPNPLEYKIWIDTN